MSKLDELIAELCPDGVEYKTIGSCVEKVSNIKWAEHRDEDYRYIDLTSVDRDTHQITDTQTINANNAPSRAQQIVQENDVLLGATRPLLKRYCIIPEDYDGEICSTGFCVLRAKTNSVLSRYLYHIISSTNFFLYVEKYQKGASYPAISDADTKSYKFPVPPLEVQREIVRVLDNFTFLSAELSKTLDSELQARKNQYQEYSRYLFSRMESIRTTTLGDIVEIQMCKRIKKDQTSSTGDVPFYQNGTLGGIAKLYITNELFEEFSKKYKYPSKGEVMLSTVGTVGKAIQFDGSRSYYQDSNIVWLRRKSDEVTDEYLYWFCVSMPWKLPERATLKHLHNYMIADTEIMIPSLKCQKDIVSKFQNLQRTSNEIIETLRREIETRQKQYEYYRDKLLTFDAKVQT